MAMSFSDFRLARRTVVEELPEQIPCHQAPQKTTSPLRIQGFRVPPSKFLRGVQTRVSCILYRNVHLVLTKSAALLFHVHNMSVFLGCARRGHALHQVKNNSSLPHISPEVCHKKNRELLQCLKGEIVVWMQRTHGTVWQSHSNPIGAHPSNKFKTPHECSSFKASGLVNSKFTNPRCQCRGFGELLFSALRKYQGNFRRQITKIST